MSHWLLDRLNDTRQQALKQASRVQIHHELLNASFEVARWLGGQNSEDVSMALDWQPNDRVIGIIQAERGEALNRQSYDYQLRMETVHTTRHTLIVDELLSLPKSEDIASTYSKVSDSSSLAAVTDKWGNQRDSRMKLNRCSGVRLALRSYEPRTQHWPTDYERASTRIPNTSKNQANL